jgi:hypothetical protein
MTKRQLINYFNNLFFVGASPMVGFFDVKHKDIFLNRCPTKKIHPLGGSFVITNKKYILACMGSITIGAHIRYVASPYIDERISSYEASTVDATCVM